MESIIHLDTHVVVWLYLGDLTRFSTKVLSLLRKNSLVVSPMVILELEYLHEIKRIKVHAQSIVDDLETRIGLSIDEIQFSNLVRNAVKENWTRDPFDRLIATHAKIRNVTLISKDKDILENYSKAVW